MMRIKSLWLGLFLLAGACGADDKGDSGAADSGGGAGGDAGGGADGVCESDSWWTGGNQESPRMHPGVDCIACHESSHEGPAYTVAGTVFTDYDEPDDCNGREGVVVEVTDAAGDVWTETTNSAGNFFFRDSALQFPIRARVIDGVDVREMSQEVTTGACGSCHTSDGEESAPGRVIAP